MRICCVLKAKLKTSTQNTPGNCGPAPHTPPKYIGLRPPSPHPTPRCFLNVNGIAFPVIGRSQLQDVPMAWRRRRQAKAKWHLGRRKWRGTQTWGVSATWPWPGTVSTVQHDSTVQCSTLHYTTLHHTTLHYTTLHCNAVRSSAVQCSTVQYISGRYHPAFVHSIHGFAGQALVISGC